MGDYCAALMHADTGLQCWCYPLIDVIPTSCSSYPSINECSRPSTWYQQVDLQQWYSMYSIDSVDLAAVTMTRTPPHICKPDTVENCRARIPYPSLWVYSPVKRQQRMIGDTCRRQRWRETGGQPTGRIISQGWLTIGWWRLRTPPDARGRRGVVNPRGWLNVCRFTGSGGCCREGVCSFRCNAKTVCRKMDTPFCPCILHLPDPSQGVSGLGGRKGI